MLANDFLYAEPYNLVIFPDNHDMTRFFTQVKNDLDLFYMGIVYYVTMRGIPQFFYGTEILMNSNENPGNHGLIRSNFPGGFQVIKSMPLQERVSIQIKSKPSIFLKSYLIGGRGTRQFTMEN